MSNRILPKSNDPILPIMVIPSYARAGNVTTINKLAFAEQQKVILLHNDDERDAYEMIQDLTDAAGNAVPLMVTNQRAGYPGSGKARQMQWAYDQLEDGEFIVFADDDITHCTWLPFPEHERSAIDFDNDPKPLQDWARLYDTQITPDVYRFLIDSTIKKMIEQNTIMGGFGLNDNFYFRRKHWRKAGFVIGHMIIMRKDPAFKFDLDIAMEDYRNSAEVVRLYGSVVLNNFACFKHSMYIVGGLGTAEERRPYRKPDCDMLMSQYPGFFRLKDDGKMAGADLFVNITDRTVDKWVNEMKLMKGLDNV